MGRLFGILVIVGAVWVGMEIYNEGMANAFGGTFAWFTEPLDPQRENPRYKGRSITQRVGQRVAADIYSDFQRKNTAIEEED